jgi:hypothetical protein
VLAATEAIFKRWRGVGPRGCLCRVHGRPAKCEFRASCATPPASIRQLVHTKGSNHDRRVIDRAVSDYRFGERLTGSCVRA